MLGFLRSQVQKSEVDLNNEARSRSKSQLSDEAQKRMQSKLKHQANKMRSAKNAKNKLAAVNAFAGAIEEEKKSPSPRERDDGYNQLIDENSGERIGSMTADEEDPMLADTIFQNLSENDPLLVERNQLKKAQKALDEYLKKRADKKGKPSPQEEAMKASLQKALQIQQIKFKEEQKKAQQVNREI